MSKNKDTLADRLTWAIDQIPPEGRRRGLRLFQRRMEARAEEVEDLVGYSLSAIQGYKNGTGEPSLQWLREAASILRVREAWLVSGEGQPTEAEQEIPTRHGVPTELDRRLWRELSVIANATGNPHAVAHAFYGTLGRALKAVIPPDEDPATGEVWPADKVVRLASLLVNLVQYPLVALFHPPAPEPRKTEDYAVAAFHALSLAMPERASVQSLDHLIDRLEGSTDG